MTNKNLEGRIALITGGARGIGKAISENLAQQGCNIIIFDPGYSISGNHDDINLAEKISEEINKMTIYEDYVMDRVQGGSTIRGLYPLTDEKQKQIFETWLKSKSNSK